MPLRSAIYYGRTMEKLIDPKALYRRKEIPIPTPEFYVFYNGDEHCPPEEILKLSDLYLEKTATPMLELYVRIININLPEGHALLEQCRPLYEYSWFIQRIKEYLSAGLERDNAITLAIKDCRKEGILSNFVQRHGSEAVNMLFTQFNMEDALEVNYEEGFEDGAMHKLIRQVCKKLEKGMSPAEIADMLEEDIDLISKICSVVQSCGSKADIREICRLINR